MANQRPPDQPVQTDGSLPAAELVSPLQVVNIQYLHTARKFTRTRRIHPRRIIPAVNEGQDVPDQSPSPQAAITSFPAIIVSAGAAPARTEHLILVRKT